MGARAPACTKGIAVAVSPNANSRDYDGACEPFPSYETLTLPAHLSRTA